DKLAGVRLRSEGCPIGDGIARPAAHRAVADRAPGQSRVVRIVESPPLTVAADLELVLHARTPLELDRQEPEVRARNPRELEIIRPGIDAMAQIDGVSFAENRKRGDVV